MSYWKIAWRNMQERALASSLTGLSMALGVALMVLVLVIHQVVVNQLSNDAQGYNFIVAGKGSPYEVVLTTVFHVGKPLYPIPWKYYNKFVGDGEFAQYTDVAVPICMGDSYPTEDGQIFRVVGTTPDLFDKLSYGADDEGNEKKYKFASGRNFKASRFFEAVIGSVAANRTGLKVGDHFRPSHGISAEGDKHDEFEVVGVLAPTGTTNDRALFVNVEGFLLLDGHAREAKSDIVSVKIGDKSHRFQSKISGPEKNILGAVLGSAVAEATGLERGEKFGPTAALNRSGAKQNEYEVLGVLPPTDAATDHSLLVDPVTFQLLEGKDEPPPAVAEPVAAENGVEGQPAPLPLAQREVTSILVRCKADQMMAPMAIDMGVNKGDDLTAQAVAPVNVVERLQASFLAPMRLILLVLTVMIVIVAGISILVSIYNSMSERSHDIAVMRALGASRNAVMAVILVESILLSILGGLAGLLLGHGVLALASPVVEYYTGVTVRAWSFTWQETLLVPGLVAFAALVGFLPALSAYRTDVAKTLGGAR